MLTFEHSFDSRRPEFQAQAFSGLELMDAIGRGEVTILILAHRDRLTRFGFEWFEHYARAHGCEILVLNQQRLSPEQEMALVLMTIVRGFSARLYGLRNYCKQLNEALKHDVPGEAPCS